MNTIKYVCVKNGLITNIIVFDDPVDVQLVEQVKNALLLDVLIPFAIGASIGGTYDGEHFWGVQPYPSWVRNQETHNYEPPTLYPTDDKRYKWNEDTLSWIELEIQL